MRYTKQSIFFLLCIILFACKKDLGDIQKVQVVTFSDFSIKTNADIIDFEIIDSNLIFAVGKYEISPYFEIFKTINGGKNWTVLDFDPTDAVFGVNYLDQDYTSFGFTDENNGVIVLNKRCFRTFNGGISWVEVKPIDPYGNQIWYYNFAGRSGQNQFIFSESHGLYNYKEHIFTSESNFPTYNFVNYRYNYGIQFNKGKVTNGKLTFFTDDFNYWDDICLSYDINTNSFDTLTDIHYSGMISDVYYQPNENTYFATLDEGYFSNFKLDPYDLIYHPKTYNFRAIFQYHDRPYYAIEKIDNYFIIVGEETIATNKNGAWQEIITSQGTGQKDIFYKIKKTTGSQFIVSGNNGLFKKGILE